MKIAVTGHKNKRLRGREVQVTTWLGEQIKGLRLGMDRVECLCGGAEGADELFAEVAAFGNLDVDLVFYLPCEGYRYFALEKYMEKATRVVNIFPRCFITQTRICRYSKLYMGIKYKLCAI